jgi:hypothetical protein
MDDKKRAECSAWVAAQIEAAEAGRSELVADLVRRKEALRDIRSSEPRYTRHPSPENSAEEFSVRLRAAVYEAVGMAMGELLDVEAKAHEAERNKLRDKLRDVEIALANTKADVTNLRTVLLTNGRDAGEARYSSGVVDLPK